MACCRNSLWAVIYLPLLALLYLALVNSANSTNTDPEDAYSPDWTADRADKQRLSELLGVKRVSEFLGGPGKRVSEFLGGPGKRVSEFLGGPGKRVSEFLGGPGKRSSALSKRVSEFLGGPGKRADYYDFLESSDRR